MNSSTAYLVGTIFGSVIGIYILHAIWEFVLFKRVMDDPVKGKFASVIAAYFTASILSGFGNAVDGAFNPRGFLTYLIGAAVVGFFAIRRGMKLRDTTSKEEEVLERFN